MFNPRLVLTAFVAVFIAAACRPEPPPPPPAPTGPTPEELEAKRIADSIASAEAEALRLAAEKARLDRERMERARQLRATLEEMVFFDYDEANIRTDARSRLEAKLEILRDYPSVLMRMEGHADERGTSEYNVALGNERAESVILFLTGYGLDGVRFESVSYGEESPIASGSNEAAWAQNRRVEFVITGGAGDLGR
ncbi:MAG: OmpA family protein [Gemmatimonadota bacterium]|nr:OmpA family protein [Gemmatimonadota bacterium]MDE2872303.1 OmpA family protein [Gemmatimonadota bacterium]